MLIAEWLRRVHYRLNRRRLEAELRDEMDAHREVMGAPARFGNELRLREQSRAVWGWTWLDALDTDVRVAVRGLWRQHAFTVTAAGSLALGFALVASTLTVTNAYLLRTWPYAQADRLYHVMYAPADPWEPGRLDMLDWSATADVVEAPITASGATFYLSGSAGAQTARGLRVNREFVVGLGLTAAAGRMIDARDFAADADRTAMIGYALWRDRYGASADAIGQTLSAELDGAATTQEIVRIVGVLPRDFYFGRDSASGGVDVLLPATRPARTYMVRLRPNVPRELAERRITDAVRATSPDLPADWTGVHLEGVRDRYVADVKPLLVGVTIAAAFVFGLVALNVSVLTLMRAMRRHAELAVRTAIGSTRGRLVRLLAVESAVLCGLALTVGLGLSTLVLQRLGPAIETRLGRAAPSGSGAFALDTTVLLLLGIGAAGLALAFSLAPLVTNRATRLATVLRGARAGSDRPAMRRLRATLVGLQLAGTLIVLCGGAVMLRGVTGMLRADLGFNPDQLVRGRLVLRSGDYASADAFFRAFDRFAEQLRATYLHDVVFATWPPFVDRPVQTVERDGEFTGGDVEAGTISVSGDYMKTMGGGLLAGRDLTREDARRDDAVAVVSESLAARLWPGSPAVGHRIRLTRPTPQGPSTGPWRTVVGVVRDMRQEYHDRQLADVYLPLSPAEAGRYGTFYVRTDRSAPALTPELRAAAAGFDPNAVIDNVRSVASENAQLEGARFLTEGLSVVSMVTLVLGVLGVYGIVAYTVQQREREMAIRIALGATAGSIRGLFLRETAVVIAAGLAVGLLGSIGAVRVLASQISGVPHTDLLAVGTAAVLLATATTAAGWWPARRAAKANPMAVLKEE